MNATFRKSSFLSVLILSMLASGCMAYQPAIQVAPQILNGDVQAVSNTTAQFIVDSAVQGVAGSQVWVNGSNVLAVAPVGENIGFVVANADADPIQVCGGNIANCQTVKALIDFLKTQGWQELPMLPQAVITVLEQGAPLFTPVIIGVTPYSPVPTGIVQ